MVTLRKPQSRWLLLTATALLAGAAAGTLLSPAPALAQKKEIVQLQRDMSLLMQSQREMERKIEEKHTILKTLVEQAIDNINRYSMTIGALQKTVQDVQANSGARTDSLATQVQALADNLEEVKVRMGRLSQQLADAQNILQTLDARVTGGAPISVAGGSPGGAAPGAPPPSADVLYSNALRDFTSAKYDLARQEFLDYLQYYPDTDLASNARFYIGEIYFAQKQYREAIAEYDQVLDNFPRSFKLADARLKKALALIEIGQRTTAQRELREVVRRHPGTEAERRANAKLRELAGGRPSS